MLRDRLVALDQLMFSFNELISYNRLHIKTEPCISRGVLGETLRLRNPLLPSPHASVTNWKPGLAQQANASVCPQAIVGTGKTMKALLKHVEAFRPQMIKVAA